MLLAVDIGNTNTLFAVFEGQELRGQWRMATIRHRTADEYFVWLSHVLQEAGLTFKSINAAIIATVVPETQFAITQLCRKYFHIEHPLMVGDPSVKLGIEVKLERPEEVGADRLVNAIEAWRKYKRALIVIDFGTATTFDVVNGQGAYVGGVIAPGVNLSLDALHQAAAKLPSIRIRTPDKVIGTNTVGAMESGIYFGYVGLIEGIVTRIAKEFGAPMKVIATGGLAPLYSRATPMIEETLEDLTIYGLRTIYERNASPTLEGIKK